MEGCYSHCMSSGFLNINIADSLHWITLCCRATMHTARRSASTHYIPRESPSMATKCLQTLPKSPLVVNYCIKLKMSRFSGNGKEEEDRLFLWYRRRGVRKVKEWTKKFKCNSCSMRKEKVLFPKGLSKPMLTKYCSV